MHFLEWFSIFIVSGIGLTAAGHALLHKRDSRSALGWVAVCLTFPLAGPTLYILFGVNRVRRSASRMRRARTTIYPASLSTSAHSDYVLSTSLPQYSKRIAQVGHSILGTPCLGGNCVEPLYNGDQAYPAMLAAIESATQSIYLASYILAADSSGKRFIYALEQAMSRGVDVRVLVDGIGEKYSWPFISRVLRKTNIPVALFTPPHFFPPELHLNLRNHRKILVVDGQIGFTGGMNIRQGHVLAKALAASTTDLHFAVRGPIVTQLQDVFVEDWFFATAKQLTPPVTQADPRGDCLCRAVVNGPDAQSECLNALLTGVISTATHNIRIMTPYFLPPRSFLGALLSARHRGVQVDIILPSTNNIPLVHWAAQHILGDLAQADIHIWFQPPPFCHTKLLLIDTCYVHLGSANLDSRSLRLNFELTLEVFDTGLARTLRHHFNAIKKISQPLNTDKLAARNMPTRLRDAFFWLFSPYL